ncbi:MAG: DUF2130 domain-containing protein [Actinobacteria bacterium]|nr:DUF2130 domain-containing protein [Actinomycetota bacterium]
MDAQVITCPQCGYEIPLTEAISHRIREEMEREFQARMAMQRKELENKEKDLLSREAALREAAGRVEEEVAKRLALEKENLEKAAREKVRGEFQLELNNLEEELKEKGEKLKKMLEAELQLRKEQRKLKEEKEAMELEIARRLDRERKSMEEAIRRGVSEEFVLRQRDYEEKIRNLTEQIGELKRRAEQGSQQAQGEVLERQVEEELRVSFPQDRIEAVSTGRKGADILQVVCDDAGRECGAILWEAKRTKAWSDGWLEKLREDQREADADIAVIVSTVLPRDIKGIGLRDRIWVCDYPSFTGLATALRAGLIQVYTARQAEVGKGHKMELLYDYLSGLEFRQRVEAMVEALRAMHMDLEREKTAMQKIWKKREKQMQRILASTAAMYGEMQGIIGASMPELEALDLKAIAPAPDDPEEGEVVL